MLHTIEVLVTFSLKHISGLMTLSQLRDYPRFSHQAKQRYTKKKVDTRFFFFESQTGERVTEITEKTKTGIKHKHVFLNFSHNYPPGTCSAVVCFDSDVMAKCVARFLLLSCTPVFLNQKKKRFRRRGQTSPSSCEMSLKKNYRCTPPLPRHASILTHLPDMSNRWGAYVRQTRKERWRMFFSNDTIYVSHMKRFGL